MGKTESDVIYNFGFLKGEQRTVVPALGKQGVGVMGIMKSFPHIIPLSRSSAMIHIIPILRTIPILHYNTPNTFCPLGNHIP